MYINNILNTDSYKGSQWLQYPKGTSRVFSYIEARGSVYPNVNEILYNGLQVYLLGQLSEGFTHYDILEARDIFKEHGVPFNFQGWIDMYFKYDGQFPLRIRSIPEGLVVPVGIPLLTVENTDDEFYWATSWIEPPILRSVWYPTTVATYSYEIKKIIKRYFELTGADLYSLDYRLHDFGSRGVSSAESAYFGGIGHLLNFNGSDNLLAIQAAMQFYDSGVCAKSIPASEHSTITSWGRDREKDAFNNMIDIAINEGCENFSCVSDSYDIEEACHIWGELKDKIVKSGLTVVVRPDSGDPVKVILKCLEILEQYYGSELNQLGYKVLKNARVIQADGIDCNEIESILMNMMIHGWSAENIFFGMGGKLLQDHIRDDFKFAMKCSLAKIGDQWIGVQKDPKTDSGKKSKVGRLGTVYTEGLGYRMIRYSDEYTGVYDKDDIMRTVWENGELIVNDNFKIIKSRIK